MDGFIIKDSGKREEFQTGAVRDTQDGKGRFDLISPVMARRLAVHLQKGSKKYGDRNWEKGMPVSRFMDSALRHLNCYLEGMRDEDHLSAAIFNVQGIIHTEEMVKRGLMPKELLDLPSYLPKQEEPKRMEEPTDKPKLIGVDMDKTLCIDECWTAGEISQSKPNLAMVAKVNELYRHNFIIIYTARRDELIFPTLLWLRVHGVQYHAISNRKIPLDMMIDDKSITPEEFTKEVV